MENGQWQVDIRLQLVNIYRDDKDGLEILLKFLGSRTETGPLAADAWSMLRLMWEHKAHEHLRAYTDNIIRQEREREQRVNPNRAVILHAKVNGVKYANLQDPGIRARIDPNFATAIFHFIQSNEGAALGFGAGLAQVWDALPKETQTKVIENIAEICGQRVSSSHSLSVANNFSGTTGMYAVGICLIVVKCSLNVTRWCNGQLSAERCAKNCVDSIIEYSAGFLGALGGAALGAMVNPFLAAFMGALGGVVSAAAAKSLIGCLTSEIFNLKVTPATENAYRFLELDHRDPTPEDIDVAYEAMMIRNHQEKNQETRTRNAMMLNINMAIIQRDQRERVKNFKMTGSK